MCIEYIYLVDVYSRKKSGYVCIYIWWLIDIIVPMNDHLIPLAPGPWASLRVSCAHTCTDGFRGIGRGALQLGPCCSERYGATATFAKLRHRHMHWPDQCTLQRLDKPVRALLAVVRRGHEHVFSQDCCLRTR